MQPICTVDEPSFRHLLEIAEPRFQLPHRTHFTDKIVPSKYREVHSIVEKHLVVVDEVHNDYGVVNCPASTARVYFTHSAFC